MASKVAVPKWLLMLLVMLVVILAVWAYDTHVHRYMCMTWGKPGELVQCRVRDGGW